MCKISIIIPLFNAEKTLERCINSVLAQSFDDFEMFLINDGSTDGSEDICLKFADKDKRIKYIKKENGGAASARNLGITKAKGDYLCFVDCDDYIDSDMLSFMYGNVKKTDADIVICGYYMENGNSVAKFCANDGIVSGNDINSRIVELKSKNLIDSPWSKLYKREFVLKSGIKMPENEIFEDTDFNLRLLKFKPKIAIYGRCFYHYVLFMGSTTRRYNPDKLNTIKKRAELLYECTSGVESYCDFYYIKSVFSAIIDMFFSCKLKEIKNTIKCECNENQFKKASSGAKFSSLGSKIIILTAKSRNTAVIYLFCYLSYILKYKLQRLFLKVR